MRAQKVEGSNLCQPPELASAFDEAVLVVDGGPASPVHHLQQRLIDTYVPDQSLAVPRSGRKLLSVCILSLALWGIIGAVGYAASVSSGVI